jgi:hypothetical protein
MKSHYRTLGAYLYSTFQRNSVFIFTNVDENSFSPFNVCVSRVTPRIPGTLKNSMHMSCFRRNRLNQTPNIVLRVVQFWNK